MRKSRSVQLFSFSFVDILATTIGVLLFILLMAVVNQSGLVEHEMRKRELEEAKAAAAAAEQAERDAEAKFRKARERVKRATSQVPPDAAATAKQAEALADENAALAAKNDAARKQVNALSDQQAELRVKLARFRRELARPEDTNRYVLPKAREGSSKVAVHVDCRADGLAIIGSTVAGGGERRAFCPADRIGSGRSVFGRLLSRLKQGAGSRPGQEQVLVLWIRPDGISTSKAAMKAAKSADVPLGWEPADPDWVF
jgi:hypothetical protein